MEGQLPAIAEVEIEAFVWNEVEAPVMKQFDKAKQYFKPPATTTSEEVELLHKNLVLAEKTIDKLKAEPALEEILNFLGQEIPWNLQDSSHFLFMVWTFPTPGNFDISLTFPGTV